MARFKNRLKLQIFCGKSFWPRPDDERSQSWRALWFTRSALGHKLDARGRANCTDPEFESARDATHNQQLIGARSRYAGPRLLLEPQHELSCLKADGAAFAFADASTRPTVPQVEINHFYLCRRLVVVVVVVVVALGL